MFDLKEYYSTENDKINKSYQDSLQTIREICNETENYKKAKDKREYYRFFNTAGKFIVKLADYEKIVDNNYFSKKPFEELLNENTEFYNEVKKDNYKASYANPTYCAEIFGAKLGGLISYFYCQYRLYIFHSLYHRNFRMEEYNRLFTKVFEFVKNNRRIDYQMLRKLITQPRRKRKRDDMIRSLREQFDKDFRYLTEIVVTADPSDNRYLFRYGRYITDNEINTAKFLSTYPVKKIKKLSNQIVNAYVKGFKRDSKDMSAKSTVGLIYCIGQEAIVQQLVKDLRKHKLEAFIKEVSSTQKNKQYSYDHRFDAVLYLDEEYTTLFQKDYREACENCKEILSACSGMIHLSTFGEPSFTPENKKGCLKFNGAQQKLFRLHQNNIARISEEYFPRREISFTIISFPSPEIGDEFEHIFEDILEVNLLDTEYYERIQQRIIDALDTAYMVHIKGKGKNRTNIKVKLHELKNPERETNFQNCGADVNIPIGEVYTSPQLRGTNGILHVDEAYLRDLKFVNLELTFKDGYIVNYDCGNFSSKKDNKRYIEENLLFPHETLPLGEFAIGTNTLAYVIAKKYNILNILPILIIEKMGPHFAIGDTCFSLNEDVSIFNRLDKKEIVARENEKTALRKENMQEAYTYKHTDITLPYESIEFIAAVTKKGQKIDIIRDGRFVLHGTEELNRPFDYR